MIYTSEVQHMCPIAKGAYHGPAPIPEEGKWVQAKEIGDISGFTHGIGWCAPQQGACKLTLNVKNGVIEEALVETHKEHQRTGTSDRCKCIYTDKLSGNDRIHNVIKLLKNISQEHRDHKHNDQFDRIPCCHVICSIFFHFYSSPTKSRKKHCALSCHFVILHLLITML